MVKRRKGAFVRYYKTHYIKCSAETYIGPTQILS